MEIIKFMIYLVVTSFLLGTGLVIYAHTNFSTKETTKMMNSVIIKRLDRIENKVDKILDP